MCEPMGGVASISKVARRRLFEAGEGVGDESAANDRATAATAKMETAMKRASMGARLASLAREREPELKEGARRLDRTASRPGSQRAAIPKEIQILGDYPSSSASSGKEEACVARTWAAPGFRICCDSGRVA